MTSKSKSLTFTPDPMRAMAELQELNDAPSEAPEKTKESTNQDITSNITSKKASQQETKKPTQQRSKKDQKQYAQELASTPMAVITLRLPEGLNDWLDDYAHAHRKQGVKKQDLISEAVQLLVVAKDWQGPD